MHELAGGLWTWTGRHPDWNDDPHWGPDVRSYALRTDEGVILFDPIGIPDELTREGNVQVVLTAEWHGRDAKKLGLPIRGDDLPPEVTAQPAFDERLLRGDPQRPLAGKQREAATAARPANRAPPPDARRPRHRGRRRNAKRALS